MTVKLDYHYHVQTIVEKASDDVSSTIYAYFACFFVLLLFLFLEPAKFVHWMVFPILYCGTLLGTDTVDWLRGRIDALDPIALVGGFGLHFFFLSPLLIVLWDYQMAFLPPIEDWRPWLGWMAVANAIGLSLYRISRGWIPLKIKHPRRILHVINPKKMAIVLYFAMGITAAMQIWLLMNIGGLTGYISQYELANYQGFDGFGVFFTFSESFPFLLMIAFALHARSQENPPSWAIITLYLLFFFILRLFFFGGLRGSRGNTIYAMIWAIGVVHLWIRPLNRKMLMGGVIAGIIFLYIMGFYKTLGSDFDRFLQNPTQLQVFEAETNRTLQLALISDLSRTDVQAYMLHNLVEMYPDFSYAWGRTYIAGYLVVIPESIWINKPPVIEKEGTDALNGPGSYQPGVLVASRVYGLMGEAMLNFTIYLAPLLFITLGLVVGITRRWFYNLHPHHVFRLWLPFLLIFCVTYIVSNSDNNAVFFVLRGLVPALVLIVGSSSKLLTDEKSTRLM
ncbi:MAG: hypothetical protein AAF846_16915 [Chloroflexota bacterium]